MRNLLALVGAGTVTFVGLGWYLDWYRVERQPGPAGVQRLQLDINPKKIGEDVQAGIERGAELVDGLRNKGDKQPVTSLSAYGGPTNPALPGPGQGLTAYGVPPEPARPPVANSGWRPIGIPATSPQQEARDRFNVRPLPPPR